MAYNLSIYTYPVSIYTGKCICLKKKNAACGFCHMHFAADECEWHAPRSEVTKEPPQTHTPKPKAKAHTLNCALRTARCCTLHESCTRICYMLHVAAYTASCTVMCSVLVCCPPYYLQACLYCELRMGIAGRGWDCWLRCSNAVGNTEIQHQHATHSD